MVKIRLEIIAVQGLSNLFNARLKNRFQNLFLRTIIAIKGSTKHLKPFKSKISSGWLRRYTAFAKSANVGGTLMSDEEFEERKAERQAQEKD